MNGDIESDLKKYQDKVFVSETNENGMVSKDFFYNVHEANGVNDDKLLAFSQLKFSHLCAESINYKVDFVPSALIKSELPEANPNDFEKFKKVYSKQISPLIISNSYLFEKYAKISDDFFWELHKGNYVLAHESQPKKNTYIILDAYSSEIESCFNRWFLDGLSNGFIKPVGLTEAKNIILKCFDPQWDLTDVLRGFEYFEPEPEESFINGIIPLSEEDSNKIEEICNKFLYIVKPLFE